MANDNKEINRKYLIKGYMAAFTCSNLSTETLEQSVKYVESYQQRHQNYINDIILASLLLALNIFQTLL